MTDRERFDKRNADLHGVKSTHLRSEPVHETFQGTTVWKGFVEVFALKGHPKAGLAYAGVMRRTTASDATSRSWAWTPSRARRTPCGPRLRRRRSDRRGIVHDVPRIH